MSFFFFSVSFSVGSKAQQRQKQSKLFKKKDINRKGVEKEGTDMDAFVEHVSQPAAPPPAGAAPTAISVEVPAFSTTNCTATVTVTTVIQETTIAPASSTATSTTTTTSTSVPTSSISSSHTQQQSSQQTPPLEKRIPAIPSLSSKQVQVGFFPGICYEGGVTYCIFIYLPHQEHVLCLSNGAREESLLLIPVLYARFRNRGDKLFILPLLVASFDDNKSTIS